MSELQTHIREIRCHLNTPEQGKLNCWMEDGLGKNVVAKIDNLVISDKDKIMESEATILNLMSEPQFFATRFSKKYNIGCNQIPTKVGTELHCGVKYKY